MEVVEGEARRRRRIALEEAFVAVTTGRRVRLTATVSVPEILIDKLRDLPGSSRLRTCRPANRPASTLDQRPAR